MMRKPDPKVERGAAVITLDEL
jgi:hypothetical protein